MVALGHVPWHVAKIKRSTGILSGIPVNIIMTKYVMITLTEKCNLDCIYCYEKNKTLKTISFDLMIDLIENELYENDGYDVCEITLHGGEPFLEFKLLKKVCEYVWSKSYPKKYYFFASTNGTLVHGEIKDWLYTNRDKFICGLSIDGNKSMQDVNRNNSFDAIDIDFFVQTWPKQEVKTTISPLSLPYYAEGIIYLQEKGFKVSDNFAYGLEWSNERYYQTLLDQLLKLTDYYLENPEQEPSRLLSVKLDYLAYNYEDDRVCGIGKGMKVYDVDGEQYACHFFEPLAIGREKAQKSLEINFSKIETYYDLECQKCGFRKICPTCYGANYSANGNIAIRDKNMCELTKISAIATARFMYEKISRYGIKSISEDIETQKAFLIGIEKVQELL